jgi:hypothetical protein
MYVQGNATPSIELTGMTVGENNKDWVRLKLCTIRVGVMGF